MHTWSLQSCPTLCDHMDCSPPGSSVRGILQARILESFPIYLDFSGSSASRESACNLGDSGLIPGSERSPGEQMGYPLQYSWASLVVQTVKNLPAMLETWVWSLGWEDPLEKGWATHSSILELPGWLTRSNWETSSNSLSFKKLYFPILVLLMASFFFLSFLNFFILDIFKHTQK